MRPQNLKVTTSYRIFRIVYKRNLYIDTLALVGQHPPWKVGIGSYSTIVCNLIVMINQSNYSASFTAGALLYEEINSVIDLLKQNDFVQLLDMERFENNFLKIKTENARIRVTTEIKKRARSVEKEIWAFFESCTEKEQRILLFYVLLKSSVLAMDYHFEVTIKKWRKYDLELSKLDIQMRLDELSSFDEEVASWSDTTKTKTITQYIRALREAGLLRGNRLSQVEILNHHFWKQFLQWRDEWFLEACFLNQGERNALR